MELRKHLSQRLMLLALSTATLVITYYGLLLYRHTPAVQAQEVHVICGTTAIPVSVKEERVSQSSNNQPQVTQLSSAPVTVSVPLPEPPASASLRMPSALSPQRSHFVLNISGIKYDPRNVIPYGIYINLPQGVTPNPESPYYVGKLALFAYPQGGTFSIDVTHVLGRLQNFKLITGDTISVTFAPPKRIVGEVTPQSQGKICFTGVTITRR
jgi:tyrosinase